MPDFLSLLMGRPPRRAVETVIPERTFADVILPPATRRTLDDALAQVRNHTLIFNRWGLGERRASGVGLGFHLARPDAATAQLRTHALIFNRWGLGERHASGLGLAFNFAGPPGTGKTICAEAIAHALGMKLLVVNYAEVESMWVGETPKNIVAAFRAATEQNAVLFFDEADAIAGRRSSGGGLLHMREANITVNVLLRELEEFNGVVIFATNLAANFDPAFERRIRTHVRFEMPGVDERERIWRVQIHPKLPPRASAAT